MDPETYGYFALQGKRDFADVFKINRCYNTEIILDYLGEPI